MKASVLFEQGKPLSVEELDILPLHQHTAGRDAGRGAPVDHLAMGKP